MVAGGTPADAAEKFLDDVWTQSCQKSPAINRNKRPQFKVRGNNDHAVTWALFYTLANVHQMIEVQNAINRVAYELQQTHAIELRTPLTHQVEMSSDTESTPEKSEP